MANNDIDKNKQDLEAEATRRKTSQDDFNKIFNDITLNDQRKKIIEELYNTAITKQCEDTLITIYLAKLNSTKDIYKQWLDKIIAFRDKPENKILFNNANMSLLQKLQLFLVELGGLITKEINSIKDYIAEKDPDKKKIKKGLISQNFNEFIDKIKILFEKITNVVKQQLTTNVKVDENINKNEEEEKKKENVVA